MFDAGMLFLHVAGAVIWNGGMLFAHQVLRPAAGPLDSAPRLALWVRVFRRFFPWVWASIAALVSSGYIMVASRLGGLAQVKPYVWAMQGLGLAMIVIFCWVFFRVFPALRLAAEAGLTEEGLVHLALIRRLIGINIIIGLVTIAVATGGRFT